jgi:uncharacterized protein YbbC (DUF1343 family)
MKKYIFRIISFSLLLVISSSAIYSKTKTGLDEFISSKSSSLKSKRIGYICNRASRTLKGEFGPDVLLVNKDLHVVAFFSPEHGFDGERKAGITSDSASMFAGVPIYSLYGATRKPTKKMLARIDVLVFDMQDIGVRPYTFLSTMINAMEAAAENKIEFIVLDRPNPLGGERIEGNILDSALRSFVGIIPIPYIHGMTLGELALMAKGEKWFKSATKLKLRVIKMEGWKRSMLWNETGLKWTPPSPNIPTPASAIGAAMLGATGELGFLSIGIGSDLPFLRIGSRLTTSEWLEFAFLSSVHKSIGCNGEQFTTPFGDTIKTYNGVRIELPKDMSKVTDLYPSQFRMLQILIIQDSNIRKALFAIPYASRTMFGKVTGSKILFDAISGGKDLRVIFADWQKQSELFRSQRKKYLLYD